MKNIKKVSGLILSVVIVLAAVQPALAAQPAASLSLGGGSFDVNSTFQDTIYEDSGQTNVNVVGADMTYNPAELELVGIDTSTSAFNGAIKASGTNGSISIARYNIGGISGKAVVAVLKFRNLGSKTSMVSFAPTSQVISASGNKNIWPNGTISGATYTFVTPAAVPAPQSSPPAISPTAAASPIKPTAPKPAVQHPSTLAAQNEIKNISSMPKPIVSAPPVIELSSPNAVLAASSSALLYLAAVGWLVRSSHPAAARIRKIKPRLRRQLTATI